MNRTPSETPRTTEVGSRHLVSSASERSSLRNEVMRNLLVDLRDQELRKMRSLIHDETLIAMQAPGDELDQARRDGDLEFQVSLLDLSESRLAAITATLARLDEGRFGLCEECEKQISLTRLKSVPFARYCLDCQKESEAASSGARSRVLASAWHTNIFEREQPERERTDQAADSTEDSSVPQAPRRRRRSIQQ
jgi:RNA polymerase-binding transcription factor